MLLNCKLTIFIRVERKISTIFYLNLCAFLMLSVGQKKSATVVLQYYVNDTEGVIKMVLEFTWNNQFVVSYQRRVIEKNVPMKLNRKYSCSTVSRGSVRGGRMFM